MATTIHATVSEDMITKARTYQNELDEAKRVIRAGNNGFHVGSQEEATAASHLMLTSTIQRLLKKMADVGVKDRQRIVEMFNEAAGAKASQKNVVSPTNNSCSVTSSMASETVPCPGDNVTDEDRVSSADQDEEDDNKMETPLEIIVTGTSPLGDEIAPDFPAWSGLPRTDPHYCNGSTEVDRFERNHSSITKPGLQQVSTVDADMLSKPARISISHCLDPNFIHNHSAMPIRSFSPNGGELTGDAQTTFGSMGGFSPARASMALELGDRGFYDRHSSINFKKYSAARDFMDDYDFARRHSSIQYESSSSGEIGTLHRVSA